jgi:REP element-mobilizing transposase RayT
VARAHRHYIPGYIWHITHRCHKREFLLKYVKDRHRWLQWLFEAKKRYGLVILNYAVTSNHIHLLVYDNKTEGIISKSIQLIAGRVGQEFNQRKDRRGAFWEDRYHATIIEDGDHLIRCIVYIDLNMVRAGVVDHPGQWRHGGFNEIQSPRRKCILIDYDVLSRLAGFDDFLSFQNSHRQWINSALEQKADLSRDTKWSRSIAVGGESFVTVVKRKMGALSVGRRVHQSKDGFELRETIDPYEAHFKAEKCDIDANNTWFWDQNQ